MIYITGDTHSDFTRLNRHNFPEQKIMTKEDYVIICGDFGGIWEADPNDKSEKYWLDWLEEKNFTTLFIDGNHENYDRFDQMPVVEWNGGRVHQIRPSVYHLMRGQIYHLDKTSFFTFGGARSHDIADGVWEADDTRLKNKRLLSGMQYRINHVSWWAREMPSPEEMDEGRRNLEEEGWKVDFILSHCGPTGFHEQMGGEGCQADELTEYLEEIRRKCSYKYWFCGHYHRNLNLNRKDKVIYEQIIRIA